MSDSQVATHFRCNTHDVVLPLSQWITHCNEAHEGRHITIQPIFKDA